jgi:hypothetical protein
MFKKLKYTKIFQEIFLEKQKKFKEKNCLKNKKTSIKT